MSSRTGVNAVVVAAGVAALWAPGAPTGVSVADHLYRAGFAVLFTLSAPRVARSRALAAAVIGGAAAQLLLRLGHVGPFGATAAVSGLVFVVVAGAAWRRGAPGPRRRLLIGTGGFLGLGVVAAALYGVAALAAHQPAERALAAAENGLSAARQGRTSDASAAFATARADLAVVHDRIGAWWALPGRVVPIVGPNAHAVDVLVSRGRAVMARGSALVAAADRRSLRFEHATIDTARVDALHTTVLDSQRSLADAISALGDARSGWLVPALRVRMDRLTAKLRAATSEENTLVLATGVLPDIFGEHGPRTWLLTVLDNSELRGGGGVIADFGELRTAGGHLSLARFDAITELTQHYAPPGPALTVGPPDYIRRYAQFWSSRFIADAFYSPDFPTDAGVVAALYPRWGGVPVSGVISIDPFGLAGLLQLTGPVSVPEWPVPITSVNVVPILLHDEYVRFSGEPRQRFLAVLAHRVFDALTSARSPSPDQVVAALGPAVAGKHLQLWSGRATEEELFARIGADGRVPAVDGDFLEVVTQNAAGYQNGGRIDWFLHRAVSYAVELDPRGDQTRADLHITLTNDAPASGAPAELVGGGGAVKVDGQRVVPGDNDAWLSVYSPLSLEQAELDGQPFAMTTGRELGRNVFAGYVLVPPGGSRSIELHLAGPTSGSSYRLFVGRQPTARPDQLTVTFTKDKERPARLFEGSLTSDKRFHRS